MYDKCNRLELGEKREVRKNENKSESKTGHTRTRANRLRTHPQPEYTLTQRVSCSGINSKPFGRGRKSHPSPSPCHLCPLVSRLKFLKYPSPTLQTPICRLSHHACRHSLFRSFSLTWLSCRTLSERKKVLKFVSRRWEVGRNGKLMLGLEKWDTMWLLFCFGMSCDAIELGKGLCKPDEKQE